MALLVREILAIYKKLLDKDNCMDGIHMHLHDLPFQYALVTLCIHLLNICKETSRYLPLFPLPDCGYYLHYRFIKNFSSQNNIKNYFYLYKFQFIAIYIPNGPLQVGQQLSFGLQLLQTRCPLWHCKIGGRT